MRLTVLHVMFNFQHSRRSRNSQSYDDRDTEITSGQHLINWAYTLTLGCYTLVTFVILTYCNYHLISIYHGGYVGTLNTNSSGMIPCGVLMHFKDKGEHLGTAVWCLYIR